MYKSILASHSQQRFYFLNETVENPASFYEHEVIEFQGKLHLNLIEAALYQLMQRHEILRSRYKFDNHGALCYEVLDQVTVPLTCVDTVKEAFSLENYLIEEKAFMQQAFNLNQDISWRVKLFHVSNDTYVALFVFHHIMMDGFSLTVIFKDLSELFQLQLNQSLPLAVTTPALQYRQFCQWEREWQKTANFREQMHYWKIRLQDYASQIELLSDLMASNTDKKAVKQGQTAVYSIPKTFHQCLMTTAKNNKLTPFILYLAAYFILMNKHTQQNDIVIGTPFLNRELEDSETAVGCFINTLPVRCQIKNEYTFLQLLQELNKNWQYDLSNAQIPYDVIMSHATSEKKQAQDHLIQVFFAYQLGMPSITGTQINVPFSMQSKNILHRMPETVQYSLTFEVIEKDGEIHFLVNYRSDLYSKALVDRLFNHYFSLLTTLVVSPETKIQYASMLTQQERHQQLVEWNQTEKAYPSTTLHELFEAQVNRTPGNIALVYEDETMTYAELNTRANQVAHYLRQQGVGSQPDMFVGLGTKRSFETIIGILAILKAGAAYVPLDPVHPDDRLRHMLQDTQIKYLLTQSQLVSRWESLSDKANFFVTVALDESMNATEPFLKGNLPSIAKPQHLAYVIYTSGSTGQPKGTMIQHAGIVNICRDMSQLLQIDSFSHVIQFASMNFDAMVIQWSTALTQGARLYLLSSRHSVLESLLQVLEKHPIEVMDLTPSVLAQIPETYLSHIKTLVVAGESLNQSLLNRWKHRCRLINAYGPTESSVCVTAHVVNPVSDTLASCIGRAMANITLYVLNESQQLLPTGATGELYIGGIGLARGYLNQEKLTQERFIWHKFSEDSEPVRLYKTGDLVRYLPNGNIEYIGRTDHQVKLRGFRIELGEIEAQLVKQADIAQAVVLAKSEGGDKKLVAYLVAPRIWAQETAAQQTFIQALRKQLAMFLPDYMVPAHMIVIEQMPLTVNGKIDQKALQAIVIEVSSSNNYFIAPTTKIEKQLAQLWSRTLNIPEAQTGIHDNFFEQGGNSILAMQFVLKAKKQLSIEITVGQFYQAPSIAMIISALNDDSPTLDPCFIPLSVSANKPVLFLVHEIYGMAMAYTRLLPALAQYFSIYGINYPSLMSEDMVSYASLEALAADYIQKIRRLVPDGPYHLGGWSFGGNISLEMTHQLQTQGKVVETLFILDSIHVVYKEYIGTYLEIIGERELPRQNITGEIIQRQIAIGKHLAKLVVQSSAKKLNPIPSVYFLKCQGEAFALASQYKAGIDWRFKDVMNGLRHYLSREQRVHLGDISYAHYFLFEHENTALLNTQLTALFQETENDTYEIGEDKQSILTAERKNALYLQKGFYDETGRFDADLRVTEESIDKNERLAYGFFGEPQLLLNMTRLYQMHRLNTRRLLESLSLNKRLTKQMLQLLLEFSPRYAPIILLQVTQKLLVLRLASTQSIALIDAFVFDDMYRVFMLQIAQKLTLPFWNYVNVAISRNEGFRVGETFDASLWLCSVMAIPMGLYALLAQNIGEAEGLDENLVSTWQDLAWVHMFAILPSLFNITIENFYYAVYDYYLPLWATACGAILTLSTILLCMSANNLNGVTLGLSLSIGSCAQLLFYLVDLHKKGHFAQYQLFQHFPWQYIKRYFQESYVYTLTSSVSLIYLVIAAAFASSQSELELTAYFIALCCMSVISLGTNIISATSSNLFLTFILGGSWFSSATAMGIISVTLSFMSSVLLAIPFLNMTGQAITRLFIDTQDISASDRSSFFHDVKMYSYFFILLSFIIAIRVPVSNYLLQYNAYSKLLQISLLCDVLFPAAVFTLFSMLGNKDIVMVLGGFLGLVSLGTVWTVYEWLRISDFHCHPKQEEYEGSTALCFDLRNLVSSQRDKNYFSRNKESDNESNVKDLSRSLLSHDYGLFGSSKMPAAKSASSSKKEETFCPL